ncbi:MAG: STAS-like domain-containing protein [Bacteroidia bacterium]
MSTNNVIDLELYRTPGSRVFTGRDRGIEVRDKSKIDEIESNNDEVIVVIPTDIGSINPSFLEEFFYNVVVKLKEDGFFQKFKFKNEGRYKIMSDLQEAVERILREETALVN